MIALEIQALSERRENLLIEIGRVVLSQGFTLQRQRLADDQHGVLLTMVVRGPERKQRALAAAMDAQERIISYQISAFEEGVQKPHFAASRRIAYQPGAPATEPPVEPTVVEAPAPALETIDAAEESQVVTAVELPTEPDYAQVMAADVPFALVSAPAPAPTAPPIEPFIEMIPLGPDVTSVDQMLPKLLSDYPDIFPRLQKLEDSVAEAARASSLQLAGQRLGASIFEHDHGSSRGLGLLEAIERVGMPSLGLLVEVDQQAEQLHIHHSPICSESGQSGCVFLSGFLEGLLTPAVQSHQISIFSVCCRSFGAGECILAISD
ncbi:hypothetical protein HDE78_002782 [Rhodanobacter sp. K2T2]|jgi:hypothetical protein|uniref:hypothetical protein n=1 Tax=Rhodanobacter sp. K2T2 TaxID=2723085 RepID=UPI0015CB4657|nr:hypothetical protein [Rhodanobacter sp. K2T2]NYE29814.1 hypothetical protein [Rhodanobacter sp. K2T2]